MVDSISNEDLNRISSYIDVSKVDTPADLLKQLKKKKMDKVPQNFKKRGFAKLFDFVQRKKPKPKTGKVVGGPFKRRRQRIQKVKSSGYYRYIGRKKVKVSSYTRAKPTRWTKQEINALVQQYKSNIPVKQMKVGNRSYSSIVTKISRLFREV